MNKAYSSIVGHTITLCSVVLHVPVYFVRAWVGVESGAVPDPNGAEHWDPSELEVALEVGTEEVDETLVLESEVGSQECSRKGAHFTMKREWVSRKRQYFADEILVQEVSYYEVHIYCSERNRKNREANMMGWKTPSRLAGGSFVTSMEHGGLNCRL
ncbi:2124_t:CDS:2 [Acaulospora colombiana]|uniref:2124_t:CDS:1 n=1 Tax=Acaulospora colombiana TaxID=27376 RepID=A0ACA9LZU8_9GLOM|nr:2124_t:CDS:2 [Acaulospora colombiana]